MTFAPETTPADQFKQHINAGYGLLKQAAISGSGFESTPQLGAFQMDDAAFSERFLAALDKGATLTELMMGTSRARHDVSRSSAQLMKQMGRMAHVHPATHHVMPGARYFLHEVEKKLGQVVEKRKSRGLTDEDVYKPAREQLAEAKAQFEAAQALLPQVEPDAPQDKAAGRPR